MHYFYGEVTFDALVEFQFADGLKVRPRPGLQYFKSCKDFSFYSLATIDASNKNLEGVLTLKYSPKINYNMNLLLKTEVLSNNTLGKGHNFTTERLRLGVEKGKYSFGIGADLLQTGKEFRFGYNAGCFFTRKF